MKLQATRLAYWLIAVLFVVGLPFLFALYAQYRDPNNWHWNDWTALLSSTTAGIVFFALAWIIGRNGQRRARAAADAILITSMGSLAMSSARSFAGQDQHALRIGADARAALQHYPNAGSEEQNQLTKKISESYSNLAFGTFSRADALPRSVWAELEGGTHALLKEADALIGKSGQRANLEEMREHVEFVREIGDKVAKVRRTRVPPGGSRLLFEAKGSAKYIERLELLYRSELTVIKDWAVLNTNADNINVRVELRNIADTDDWYSPWYVIRDMTDGRLKPVGYKGDQLRAEPAKNDQPQDRVDLDTHPVPLRHGAVPEGMRTEAIENLREVLQDLRSVTVCVLLYELHSDDRVPMRCVVLDGNHRLAAARLIARQARERPGSTPEVRVLAFVIEETQEVNNVKVLNGTPTSPAWFSGSTERSDALSQVGFTPDIGLMRTWSPWKPQEDQ